MGDGNLGGGDVELILGGGGVDLLLLGGVCPLDQSSQHEGISCSYSLWPDISSSYSLWPDHIDIYHRMPYSWSEHTLCIQILMEDLSVGIQ